MTIYSSLGVAEYSKLLKSATNCHVVETIDEIGPTYQIFDRNNAACGSPYTKWEDLVTDTIDSVMIMLESNRDFMLHQSHCSSYADPERASISPQPWPPRVS